MTDVEKKPKTVKRHGVLSPHRFLRTRQVIGFIREYPIIAVSVLFMIFVAPLWHVRVGQPAEVTGMVMSETNRQATQFGVPEVIVRLDAGKTVIVRGYNFVGSDNFNSLSKGSTVKLLQYNRYLWPDLFELAPLAQQP